MLTASVVVTLGGCARVPSRSETASLLAAPPTPQTVSLDLFTIRVAMDEAALDESIWSDVDELEFPLELRRRLASNGIRAGVVGSDWPARVQSLLKLEPPPAASTPSEGSIEIHVSDFEHQAPVRHRVLQVPGGRKAQILCVGEQTRIADLSLLLRDDDGVVTGRTYRKAMGMLVVRAFPQGDRRVKLDLLPEVEHGDPQRRFEPGDGMLRVEFAPQHDRFDSLRMEANLSVGQMLVVTCQTDRPGSL
ncbi:MAG TPA: hypothetical protein VHV77_09585, partial [Pirellulales bacterium]|nr:hypothetical protein [Pirellulales bacterium]